MPEVTQRQIDDANALAKKQKMPTIPNLPNLGGANAGVNNVNQPGQQPQLGQQSQPNPALQSLKRFGSMINKNVIQPVADTMSYTNLINPATLGQDILGAAARLPETIKNYDKSYNERDWSQLAKPSTDPSNQYGNNYDPEVAKQAEAQKNVPQLDAIPPVNLAETATEQPGYVSPEGVQGIGRATEIMADRDKQNSATQDESSLGGAQLPGSEFLPEKNALPSMPNIQSGDPDIQPGVPEFDNNYMQSNYSNLNDREANEARYERNKADALKQKQASSEMVDTINRGTKAMAEVRQMRSGKADGQLPGFGVMNEPAGMVGSGLGSAGYSTEDAIPEKPQVKNQLGEKRLNFDKNKYLQEEANKSNRRTGNPKDALSSDLWASVQSERDPNKKSFLMKQLQSKTGFSYEQLMDYVKKITQPRLDDDPFIGLNNNL